MKIKKTTVLLGSIGVLICGLAYLVGVWLNYDEKMYGSRGLGALPIVFFAGILFLAGLALIFTAVGKIETNTTISQSKRNIIILVIFIFLVLLLLLLKISSDFFISLLVLLILAGIAFFIFCLTWLLSKNKKFFNIFLLVVFVVVLLFILFIWLATNGLFYR